MLFRAAQPVTSTPPPTWTDSIARPDLLCNGAGTEASPFIHSAGSAGINQASAALTAGGRVRLLSSRYDTTVPILLNQQGLSIIGDSAGHNGDPNGESYVPFGTRLRPGNNPLFDVQNYGTRKGGVVVDAIYAWGVGYAQGYAAFRILSGLDQARFRNMNLSNNFAAFHIAGAEGGLDTAYFTNMNVLNGAYGYLNEGTSGSYYNHFQSGCWSDLEYAAINMVNAKATGFTFHDMTVTRCGRETDPNRADSKYMFILRGRNHRMTNCLISEAGRNYLTGAQNSNAGGVKVACDNSVFTANTAISNVTGAAFDVYGNRNVFNTNAFDGPALGGDFSTQQSVNGSYSTNLYDYHVRPGAVGNVFIGPGRVFNEGTGTIINGVTQ